MSFEHLPPEQAARAEQIRQTLQHAFDAELDHLAELLAAKPDSQLLGQTEFDVRDRVHALGAKVVETAVNLRGKGGTRAPARPARTVAKRRGSSNTGGARSPAFWDRSASSAPTAIANTVIAGTARARRPGA
jgi:hypothetical protein